MFITRKVMTVVCRRYLALVAMVIVLLFLTVKSLPKSKQKMQIY